MGGGGHVWLEGGRFRTQPLRTRKFIESHRDLLGGFQQTEADGLDLTRVEAQELLSRLEWWVVTDGVLLPNDETLRAQLRKILKQNPADA